MKKIPLSPVPAQSFKIKLGGQNCEIRVYYRFGSTYIDLRVDGVNVINGAICRDRQGVVQISQNAFRGNLLFVDMMSADDPVYTGFGNRWRFFYKAAGE